MFLRSSLSGGRLYWRVVESYRGEDGRPRHRTIHNLGPHETRDQAQQMWDDIEDYEEYIQGQTQAMKDQARQSPGAATAGGSTEPPRESLADQAYRLLQDAFRLQQARPTPPCLVELGLSAGATAEDVRAAYRRLARERHPDQGGSDAAMTRLNHAYDEALVMLGERPRKGARV